ncbi:MAG: hypothetical protein QOE41_1906 [Mycobacterium sp.]|jgi:hypothetical protein|nr:hypothetical protein [Mycobacterium sp.]MDT5132595.1 hypothetical protein [Mycobacterium sp.]
MRGTQVGVRADFETANVGDAFGGLCVGHPDQPVGASPAYVGGMPTQRSAHSAGENRRTAKIAASKSRTRVARRKG